MSIAAVRGIGVAVMTSTSGESPLAAEQVALLDAEAVLLVDHGDAEARELDAAVDQRVGADEDVDARRARRPSAMRASLGRGRAVGEQRDAHRSLAEQRALVGHDSSPSSARIVSSCCSASTSVGRHERALVAALHRDRAAR